MSGLHAETRAGSGTPIVLLHGFGSSSAAWLPIMEALQGCAMIAYDLPGHGRSLDYPNAGSPGTAAKAIVADLQEQGISRAHFVGHSMGGAIATLVALMKPSLVSSLTLLAPGGYGPEINAVLLRRFGSAAEPAEIATCLTEMSGPDAELPEHIPEDMAKVRQTTGQIAMLEKIAALITRDNRQGVIPAESVSALAMPVVTVWGTHDTVLPHAQMASMPSEWQKISLPRAGHMLIDEAAAEVAGIVRNQVVRNPRKAAD